MRRVLIALLAAGAAGCATRGSAFPVLTQTMSGDATADCAALQSELERVAVLRREIAHEQNTAGASDVASIVISAASDPLGGLVNGALTAAGAGMRNARYDRAADAADLRIHTLLTLRAERDCDRPQAEQTLTAAFEAASDETKQAREAREDAVASFLPPLRR
ncbi:MAG: hypothetical protein AB7H66_10925 [Hyphomonadaceae bacterium]